MTTTAKTCLDSAQSLRVQGSLAMDPIRGNSSKKRCLFHGKEMISDKPLPKKPRHKKIIDSENTEDLIVHCIYIIIDYCDLFF